MCSKNRKGEDYRMRKTAVKNSSLKTVLLTVLSILLVSSLFSPLIAAAEAEDQNEESAIENYEEYTYSLNEEFEELITSFDDITEEERIDFIEELKLYTDDENNLLSTHEELNVSDYSEEELEALITYLTDLRNQNIEEVEEDPSLENKDLEEIDGLEESLQGFEADAFQEEQSFETFSSQAQALSTSTINRIYGANRFETASAISQEGWSRANTVVIADANNYADALAGVPLAAALDAPILLAGNQARNQVTINEIQRLGATNAIILGGEVAVPNAIVQSLNSIGVSTRRIAGNTRYQTAGLIADEVRNLTGATEAILVSGEDFADAMSVASFAAREGIPIYLTRRRELSREVLLATNEIKTWTVIGEGSAITGAVGTRLSNRVDNFTRIGGRDRYQTNQRVINHYGTSGDRAYVATGLDFADALTGAVLAGKQGRPVVLIRNSESVIQSQINFTHARGFRHFTFFGGTVALGERIEESLRNFRLPRTEPLIVIDPGHGGSDTGANYGGVQEKNLNLSTARYLHDILVASGDYEVVMTRNSDVTLALGDRPEIANNLDADIFISIHYNAMGGANAGAARGIETFVQNFGYITDRNQFNTSDPRIRESLQLADAVHPLLISRTGLNNRGIRGQNLNVLRNTNMPAILVELGFIDNPTERNFVNTQSYRSNASHAMKDGIDRYFGN